MKIFDPQIILFVTDTERAARFYANLGLVQDYRATKPDSAPVKIEMSLDGFGLGLALPGPAAQAHGLNPVTQGQRACLMDLRRRRRLRHGSERRRKGPPGTTPVP